MTRTKRWITLAASLAVAGGAGYGGYTQRHLLLGDAAAVAKSDDEKDKAADGQKDDGADGPVAPIRVAPGEESAESPSQFNPLRGDSVVRGNDEGQALPAPRDAYEPPEFDPPTSNSTQRAFGGRAVAQVQVTESPAPPAEALTPPPTFPTEAEADGQAAREPNRFTPPPSNDSAFSNANPAAAPAPSSRFGGGEAAGGSRFNSAAPAEESLEESTPAERTPPPSRFDAGADDDYIVASSAAGAARSFDATDPTQPAPIGAGVGSGAAPLSASAEGFGGTSSPQPQPLASSRGGLASGQIEGAGQPGARELDGAQTPSLVVEKTAPPEIQIGKPAKFTIKVKNVGQATAENVAVSDRVPQGTRLIDTAPQAASGSGGSVMWQLGALRPGEEKSVSMQLMPVGEGEIGSVATVTFSTQASVRTKATRPQLLVETSGPRQVLIGQPVKLTIRLSNPGTGAATRVVLEEDVPEGLTHAGGRALEFEAGTLKPGETRELELTLSATGAGVVQNVIRARADANLNVESRTDIEVIAPQLAIDIEGPSKRFLERQATHEVIISNPGTAPAKNVEMVAHLPKGLKFVSANNEGQYDATSHAVFWSLEQLGPRDHGTVALTTVPMEAGQQKIRVESKADMNLATAQEHVVDVEGLAALFFEVADAADPIEVGGETIYEIRVINQGTKTSTNVRLAAALPPALTPLEAGGATGGVITGQQVVFEVLPRLAPKADALYRIRVQGLAKGNQQVRVRLSSDEIPAGVTKEESTRVYADE